MVPPPAMLLALLALLLQLQGCTALINSYENTPIVPHEIRFQKNKMFGPKGAPAQAPGLGRSFVRVDLQLSRQTTKSDASVQVVAVPEFLFDSLGYQTGKQPRLYCCTEALQAAGHCSKLRTLVAPAVPPAAVKTMSLSGGNRTAVLRHTFPITSTGMWVLLFSSCDVESKGLTIDGSAQWMNPYGYLPGEYFGYLPFYSWMSVVYTVTAFAWLAWCAYHWRDLLRVQSFITAAAGLAMIEMVLRYETLARLNSSGLAATGLSVFTILFSSLKSTVARLLLLLVSLGYGVVRPTLGVLTWKLSLFCLLYFPLALVRLLLTNFSAAGNFTFWMVVVDLALALADVVFFYWFFYALVTTLYRLRVRRQMRKLALYMAFKRTLIFAVVTSSLWAAYTLYVRGSGLDQLHWQSSWFLDCFWYLQFYLVLFVIMFLWRPSTHSARYAVMDELAQLDDEYGGAFDDDDDDEQDIEAAMAHTTTSSLPAAATELTSRAGGAGAALPGRPERGTGRRGDDDSDAMAILAEGDGFALESIDDLVDKVE